MNHKRAVLHVLMVLCSSVLLLASWGCGKKGPPLPPEIKGHKIAAPFDLKYRFADKEIILSWNHKIDKKTAAVKPEGFEIFMSKKTFEACEGCPFEFKQIGEVAMPVMEFLIPLEKGFRYYFRVQATGYDHMTSEFSKTIQFEYR